ncbi:MAG: DUF1592 domain-containing protein [Verrucomicrobiales bacterium]|nr:DUF1592 domain-containing protein [Verrucomicrobiales bacterium]
MMRLALLILPVLTWTSSMLAEDILWTTEFSKGTERWESKGDLVVEGNAIQVSGGLRYRGDARELSQDIRDLREFSVEFWFLPENLKQGGPARILTFSKNTSERNFTIGQEKDRLAVRLRTNKTDRNGMPGLLSSGERLRTEWTHGVFVYQAGGDSLLYLNGKLAGKQRFGDNLSKWDVSFPVLVGDEASGGRDWRGSLSDIRILDGAVNIDWVQERFEAGRDAEAAPTLTTEEQSRQDNERFFEEKVTTILTQRCLECHDSATDEGDLDLSRKLASHFEDGILIAGNAADSLLWESIESDEMPHKRDPLTPDEKAIIREWIDGGAAWTVDFIDPAIFSRPAKQIATQSRRLTRSEYAATIRDLFGVELSSEIEATLPPDVRTDGFSNTSYNLTVDLKHIEGYARIAELLAERLDSRAFAKRFSNRLDLTDKGMIPLIEKMGANILRGEMSGEEVALYRGISTSVASAGGDFEDAIATIVEAMVQSPRFLYRVEAVPRGSRPRAAGDFEVASRLSYTIWGSAPDAELLKLADEGRLNREDALRHQVSRMLKDPRAVKQSLVFASEWLHLDRLSFLEPDKKHFPDWKPELAEAMRRETLAYFEEVVWKRKRPLSALLDEPVTFVTPALAEHYGFPPVSGEGNQLVRVDLENRPERGGILTHGSILTIGGDEASMVTRGLFVLNDLLRGVIQDPPPCVDTTPVESKPGLTQRAVAMERVADKSCGGCHSKFEPLAYGLERFDGLGSFRIADAFGNQLRQDGEVLFPGDREPEPFHSVAELMELLAKSDRVRETITWKVVQFAMGRPLNARDAVHVRVIHEKAQEKGGTYEALIAALLESRLFRYSFPSTDSDSSP